MKAILTKYVYGKSGTGRYVASDGDGNRVSVQCDHTLNSDDNHKAAAQALCAKKGWTGYLVSGDTKTGMVFVWLTPDARHLVK